MRAEIKKASKKDVEKALPILRGKQGSSEFGIDPKRVIEDAIDHAEQCWVGKIDGQIVCIWGTERTGTLLSDEVYLWVLTTKLVDEHPFLFLRYSREFVKQLCERNHRVWGLVNPRYTVSIQWLKWLGFNVGLTAKGVMIFEKVRGH